MLDKRCEIAMEEMRQALTIAHLSPDLFAYSLFCEAGYMAHKAGEAIHVIKCIPVEVLIANNTDECYEQLPVFWKDSLWFLTPVTRILIHKGTQVACNNLLPSFFKVNQGWISMNPKPVPVSSPKSLQIFDDEALTLDSGSSSASAGLYSAEDMSNFMDKLMFPIEKQAILNDVARSINMEPVHDQSQFGNLISENVLESILAKKWKTIWSSALTF